jgi:hypothetical protein
MVNGELVAGLTRLERDVATRRQFRADYPREFRFRHFRPSGFGESESVARIRIYRTGDTREPASVEISTVDDTAKAGRDYQAISVRRQFAAMENELQIEVPLLDNQVSDGDRQFRIALRQPSAGYGVPSLHAPFVILDDEVALFPGSIRHLADGRTRMTLFNPPTFGEVALEASLDLKHWDFIATARADDTDQHTLTLTDDNSESSGRFYRVILP